jgi:uncharacterized protein with PIN domain
MPTAFLRFYAELNDFLPENRKQTESTYSFNDGVSVKEMIECLGVPHTQVDLILVNGRSVDFSYVASDGDRISFYPMFEALNIRPLVRLRRRPLRQVRFVLDNHLGKLAKYLRLLGFDSLYRNDYHDKELAQLSVAERRILLTRDRNLLRRKEISHGYFVQATDPNQQLSEVVARLDLSSAAKPFSRCLRCNDLLEPVAREAVIERLPARIRENYAMPSANDKAQCTKHKALSSSNEFHLCPTCQRLYWKGSHYERMRALVERILIY